MKNYYGGHYMLQDRQYHIRKDRGDKGALPTATINLSSYTTRDERSSMNG